MASDKRCKCTMAQSLTGDGCRYCQPQEYIDRLHEEIEDEAAPQPDTVDPSDPAIACAYCGGYRDGGPDTAAVEREVLERWHSKLDRIGVREVTAEKIADELRALLDQEPGQ